ncbi:MAG: hypothetical protein JNL32_14570, partial [Candidatus Kapabacteria bacterium]|nr:hypothetical protein [Candidatus Kapabacteria bacterium]
MLIEFAKHLLTPAPTILKEMGYVRELIAIEAREKRCHEAWKPHCESSMQEIKEFTSHVTETSCIAILGAALLNDVPLAYLASRFKRVELVDIVHLPSTRTKAAQFDNVVCVECDVTGYVETLYKYCKDGDKRSVLPKPSVPQLYVGVSGKPSCIVSANILSQLPIMPSLYAEKKCGYSDSELVPIK